MCGRYGRRSDKPLHLIRYADDFIITGGSKELLEDEVKPLVESFLLERGLELSAEKTTITRIEDGFDFLGQNVHLQQGGFGHLQSTLALGLKEAPTKGKTLGGAKVFCTARWPVVVLLRR